MSVDQETINKELISEIKNLKSEIQNLKKQLKLMDLTSDNNAMVVRKNVDLAVATAIDAKISPQINKINMQLYNLSADDTLVTEYRTRVMAGPIPPTTPQSRTLPVPITAQSLLAFQDN